MLTLAPSPVLRRLCGGVLDLLLPPRCLACGGAVAAAGTLCVACWRGITFLAAPRRAVRVAAIPLISMSVLAVCAARA